MEKKKVRKILLSIIIIIILLAVVMILRKAIIISSLRNKRAELIDNNNYYAKITWYTGDGIKEITTYHKDSKDFTSIVLFENGSIKKEMTYQIGESKNKYIEDEKTLIQNATDGHILTLELEEYLYENTFIGRLIQSLSTSIKEEKCNGRECYYITNLSPIGGMYIDKETGLVVRAYNGTQTNSNGKITNVIVDYQFEFGRVSDEDFKEPDKTEYNVIEK